MNKLQGFQARTAAVGGPTKPSRPMKTGGLKHGLGLDAEALASAAYIIDEIRHASLLSHFCDACNRFLATVNFGLRRLGVSHE